MSKPLFAPSVAMAPAADWIHSPFAVVEAELSPAVLVHSTNRYLGLFTGLSAHGLGAPAQVAWSTPGGPRSFKNGELLDVTRMEENWVLVWFNGAAGWTNWDSPWAIFLQHRPASMKLDKEGLHFTFTNQAGDVVLLPLYGAYKPPLAGPDPLEAQGLPGKKIKTWEWPASLPRDPLVRLRFWAGASRRFPIQCEESFSVNRGDDTVTFRHQFKWHVIEDEWNTKPLSLAPVSPGLALALTEPGFPVRFSTKPFDLEMFTPAGPYFGVPGVEAFDVTFSLLQYLNETAVLADLATNASPLIASTIRSLRQAAKELLNFPRMPESDLWLAKALPYLDASSRSNATIELHHRFLEALQPEQLPTLAGYTAVSGRPIADQLLEGLSAYVDASGNVELLLQHWSMIREVYAFRSSGRMTWAGFGPINVVESGALAAPSIAFGRLAFQAGDLDSYGYACASATRELLHLWIRQRAAGYFRRNQPIHSMAFLPDREYLNAFTGGLKGWRFESLEGLPVQRARRWDRFKDWDVARFFQDFAGSAVHRELDELKRNSVEEPTSGGPAPGTVVGLRMLLLKDLAKSAWPTSERSDGTAANAIRVLAEALGVLRAASIEKFDRLIPAGPPTPFVVGLEREPRVANRQLVCSVELPSEAKPVPANAKVNWPWLGWEGWVTPSGERWTFGQIKLARSGAPRSVEAVPINGNTRVILVNGP